MKSLHLAASVPPTRTICVWKAERCASGSSLPVKIALGPVKVLGTNRPPPPEPYDLFEVKQYQGETLKEYINRFGAQVVKVGATDQNMITCAFRRGVCPGPFHQSITQRRPRTFSEIRRRAVEHIASEEEVYIKRVSVVPPRPRAQARAPAVRVNETTTEKRKTDRRRLYEARKPLPRGPTREERPTRERARPARYHFVMDLKDLIAVPNIAERLRRPEKTDKVLGPPGVSSTKPSATSSTTACLWATSLTSW